MNRHWSAIIIPIRGELRGFFCEVAGAMASLHENNPDWAGSGEQMKDIGVPIEMGWWKRPAADFEQQVRTCCPNCGIALKRPGQLAIGGEQEEFSETHRFIARPKVRDRPVAMVTSIGTVRTERPATEYLKGVTPGYHGS